MWVLKFKSREEFNLYNKRAMQFRVKIYFYSQDCYSEKNKFYFINSGIVFGEETNKKKFFEDLKKDKNIEKLEINNDFFVSIYSENKKGIRISALETIYNKKIIYVKPTIFDEQGWEEWEIASFDRKILENVLKQAEFLQKKLKKGELKVLSFKEAKIKNLIFQSVISDLTDHQKKAFTLALENGYYGYPRKIKLEKLAKMMGISLSTFQFHLAKAEAKLMPSFSKRL